jgi:hypothetical protein
MCRISSSSSPPPGASSVGAAAGAGEGIGALFRDYGEAYIASYKPSLRVIKLIRAVRVCRTPALGGHRFSCPDCAETWYRYFSCGHSYCPLCQGSKREAWYERLRGKLLEVPYCHITFTVPHELRDAV